MFLFDLGAVGDPALAGGKADDVFWIVRRRGSPGALALAAATALAACGRINYEPVPLRAETGGGGGSGEDAGDTGPPSGPPDGVASVTCSPSAGFAAPEALGIEGLNLDLYGPRLSFDGLTLFFSQTRGNPFRDEDIWMVTRTSLDAPFGGPSRVDRLSSPTFDGSAFPTSDDQEIFFSSARPGGSGNRDLWVTRRNEPGGPFGLPVALAAVNSSANDQNPSLTADGLLLFFASDRDGPGPNEDIFVSFRTSRSAAFSRPIKVPGLASAAKESAPFISGDGQSIIFASDRQGGQGGLDIWTATRDDRMTGFDPPTLVPGVSSPSQDEDPSLSADGRELFFSSNRAGKPFVLYRALRCP